jgi:hypothetical protein
LLLEGELGTAGDLDADGQTALSRQLKRVRVEELGVVGKGGGWEGVKVGEAAHLWQDGRSDEHTCMR